MKSAKKTKPQKQWIKFLNNGKTLERLGEKPTSKTPPVTEAFAPSPPSIPHGSGNGGHGIKQKS